MDNIKVRLSIVIPGATMLSEQECSKNPKECYDVSTIVVEVPNKKGFISRKVYTIKTRKQRTVTQSISITKEGYDWMTSEFGIPENSSAYTKYSKGGLWKKMSKRHRLDAHMKLICEHLGGISFKYEIFEDLRE